MEYKLHIYPYIESEDGLEAIESDDIVFLMDKVRKEKPNYAMLYKNGIEFADWDGRTWEFWEENN